MHLLPWGQKNIYLLSFACLFMLIQLSGGKAVGQDRRHNRAGERCEPILELRWGRNSIHQHVNAELVEQYGANRVWHGPFPGDDPLAPAEAANREIHHLQNWGLEVTVAPGGIDEEKWLKKHPEWTQPWKSMYVNSRPVEAKENSLTIRLLDGHKAKQVNFALSPEKRWRVLNLTRSEMVPPERWDVEKIVSEDGKKKVIDGKVTIENVSPGDRYEVIFPVGTGEDRVDKMLPDVQNSKAYWDSISGTKHVGVTDADYSRSIHVAGFGHHVVGAEKGRLHCWFTYGRTLTPSTIEYFEEKTGREVNPMWWINNKGEVRTADDPPKEGYLDWIDAVQEQVLGYAQGYTDWVHRNDADAAVFWGDGFTGIEAYEGMIGEAGYDWVTMPSNWAVDVRRLTDFKDEHDVDRTIRIWVHSKGSFNVRWDSMRRAVLYKTPDGVSIGSQNADYHESKPQYAKAVQQALHEYDRFYRHMDNTKPFSHDLTLYVINSWGKLRSWPRSPWINNPSQTTLMELTDLPIHVKFLSLRRIGRQGVPEDADVLLNVGEPGSAWSGGHHWNEEVASNIRQYVNNGGSILGIDAPAIDEDDQFLLPDVFGLEYEGRASRAAEQELYRGTAGLFRQYQAPPEIELTLTDNAPRIFYGLNKIGTVQHNVAMTPSKSNVELLASGTKDERKAIATLNSYGNGQAAYITGNEWAANYGEFLKRLIYHLAGDGEKLMDTLDCPTPGAYVYFYPDADMLFVYNHRAPQNQLLLLGEALNQEYGNRVGLRCIYHGHQREPSIQDQFVFTADQLHRGINLEIPERSLYMYKIVEDPPENWPFGR